MRSTILSSIGAAIVAVAACANDRVSAPSGPATTDRAPTQGNVASAAVASNQGKPSDQVGFSKVTAVWSAPVAISAGQAAALTAVCPAGSTVISGGHHFLGYASAGSPPWIHYSHANESNGWAVHIDNAQPGANTVTVYIVAYCAS
jgi:hypothetical protein